MYERLIRFNEPHPSGGDATITISESKAIVYTKPFYTHLNMTDEQVLEQFIGVHWAWYVDEEPKGDKAIREHLMKELG